MLFGETGEKIAACCRRDGKHHCAKMAQMAHDGEAGGARLTASTCANYSRGTAVPATELTSDTPPEATAAVAVLDYAAAVPQTEARGRVSAARTWRERGPPSPVA